MKKMMVLLTVALLTTGLFGIWPFGTNDVYRAAEKVANEELKIDEGYYRTTASDYQKKLVKWIDGENKKIRKGFCTVIEIANDVEEYEDYQSFARIRVRDKKDRIIFTGTLDHKSGQMSSFFWNYGVNGKFYFKHLVMLNGNGDEFIHQFIDIYDNSTTGLYHVIDRGIDDRKLLVNIEKMGNSPYISEYHYEKNENAMMITKSYMNDLIAYIITKEKSGNLYIDTGGDGTIDYSHQIITIIDEKTYIEKHYYSGFGICDSIVVFNATKLGTGAQSYTKKVVVKNNIIENIEVVLGPHKRDFCGFRDYLEVKKVYVDGKLTKLSSGILLRPSWIGGPDFEYLFRDLN